MLDQVRNQAVTRSSISLYAAGMTPSGGLRVPRDVAVFPIGSEGTGNRRAAGRRSHRGAAILCGMIQARSPTNVEQDRVPVGARAGLTFTREGSRTTVVNGLGATISSLLYRDGDTIQSLTDSLPPGGKATLKTGVPNTTAIVPSSLPLSSRFVHLVRHQPAGSYLAVLDRSPFVEPGVAGLTEHGSFHLGRVAGEGSRAATAIRKIVEAPPQGRHVLLVRRREKVSETRRAGRR